MGECNYLNKVLANAIGFLFFGGLFAYIYRTYMKKYSLASSILFWVYVVIWAMYGVVYFLQHDEKMLGYNVLDFIAKCLVGLFLWAYFAKVIRL